jgi:three-Cys-motif partner protein
MATKQRFGSEHTDQKLEKLEDYLKAFSTALKHQGFHLVFFDAFAGTGDIQIGSASELLESVEEYSPFIQGSAGRALQLGAAFDEYVFVEKSRAKANVLELLKQTYPTIADRISIRRADANEALLVLQGERLE